MHAAYDFSKSRLLEPGHMLYNRGLTSQDEKFLRALKIRVDHWCEYDEARMSAKALQWFRQPGMLHLLSDLHAMCGSYERRGIRLRANQYTAILNYMRSENANPTIDEEVAWISQHARDDDLVPLSVIEGFISACVARASDEALRAPRPHR